MNVHDFLNALRYEVGTIESPAGSNCNPYSHELGRPCERWCADFAVCMANRHGVIIPSTAAYTPTLAQAFKNIGKWSLTPTIGAFVFYGHNPIHHVGIVSSISPIDPDLFTDIGGNTAHDSSHVNPNGGGVWENHRSIKRDQVNGFGMPTYDIPPAPTPDPTTESELDMPKVMHWQGAIFLTGYDHTTGTPWRRTFANMSRLEQVVGGGAAQIRPDGNAYDVTNDQFMTVYQDLGNA